MIMGYFFIFFPAKPSHVSSGGFHCLGMCLMRNNLFFDISSSGLAYTLCFQKIK